MKIKNYPGFCNLLIKDLKEKFKIDRKFFPFNDFDDVNRVKYQSNVLQFPIHKHYNQKRRVK
jgi:hypothetical protein